MGHRNIRQVQLTILIVLIGLVTTLSVAYAVLSTTLTINGNAEVSAANWDIYLDNVKLNSNSATTIEPTITNKTTASFSTTLSEPGDFYEFTIDVVNNGDIDAMIDGVTKTPTLTETQAKYLNYIVEYQNGESINTKQLVAKNSFVRLKVKVEFRKDITATDLPATSETLNLAFAVNYIQSDENGINVKDNGVEKIKMISGDYDIVGSEACLSDEFFYVISSDDESVTMISKHNLYVGNVCSAAAQCELFGEEATGKQQKTMIGIPIDESFPRYGTAEFSTINYYTSSVSSYPAYVYDENSALYIYVERYKVFLENQGLSIMEARLIKYEELLNLGCNRTNKNCLNAPEWVYSSSYWTGAAYNSMGIIDVYADGKFDYDLHIRADRLGVRPVIVISKSEF